MIGVDVGGTKVAVGLIEKGKVIKTLKEPVEGAGLAKQIARLIHQLGTPTSIGVGIAGQVEEGVVRFSPNLCLKDYPLQSLLEESFNLPVSVINDVQAAALAEHQWGAGRGLNNLAVVFLGTGIGGALLSSGRLLTGTAGEVGHMVIREGGLPCSCGRRGCLESYASGWGLARRTFSLNAEEAFKKGEEAIFKEVFEEGFEALITALANLVNLFNPEKIILGGGLLEGYEKTIPDFYSRLQESVKAEALDTPAKHFILSRAELDSFSVMLGSILVTK